MKKSTTTSIAAFGVFLMFAGIESGTVAGYVLLIGSGSLITLWAVKLEEQRRHE